MAAAQRFCLHRAPPGTENRRHVQNVVPEFHDGQSHAFGGQYIELVPNELLRYTDRFEDPNLLGDIEVTVTLEKVSVGTQMNVVQEGLPDAIPTAMSLACDAGQVVVVGSPRGKAKEVNFYDDLHRRYIEVTGAHGNMLFEPAHTRLAGAWDIDKAQHWLLAALHSGRLRLDGLITHRIQPDQLGTAYEGLLKKKEEYLGVVVRWRAL